MKRLTFVLAAVFAIACGTDPTRPVPLGAPTAAVVGDGPAAFAITCGQYNYCTFSSATGQLGTWQFSDWAAWGAAAIGSAITYQRPMSTHDPVTLATPYTTTITHTVGSDVEVGFVQCDGDWNPRRKSMCKQVRKP